MKNKKWTHSQVIGSLAAVPFAANGSLVTASNIFSIGSKTARCKLLNSNGEPGFEEVFLYADNKRAGYTDALLEKTG